MRRLCAASLVIFFLQSCGEAKPEGYCADLVQTAARNKAMYLSLQSQMLNLDVKNPDRDLMGSYDYAEALFERSRREVFDVCGSEGERFIDERYKEVYEGKM